MSADLALLADQDAELELLRRLAAESYHAGWSEGFVTAIKEYKAAQHGLYRDAQLEPSRYHVCCRECRRSGHRDGCEACQDRDRWTYGANHPDDYRGQPR